MVRTTNPPYMLRNLEKIEFSRGVAFPHTTFTQSTEELRIECQRYKIQTLQLYVSQISGLPIETIGIT